MSDKTYVTSNNRQAEQQAHRGLRSQLARVAAFWHRHGPAGIEERTGLLLSFALGFTMVDVTPSLGT